MASKIKKTLPKNETPVVHFKNKKNEEYQSTRDTMGVYHLYKKTKDGYEHLKQRKADPLFKETHPELY